MEIPNFPEFNQLFNPENNPIYIPLHDKVPIQKTLKGLTFEEIVDIARNDNELVIGMLIPKGHIVIDIDDLAQARQVFRILRDRDEKVMVVKTQRGCHIHAKCDSFTKKTTNNFLACGAQADTLTHVKGKTYITMPFKMKGNIAPRLQDRRIVYYNGIEELPFYLMPLLNKGTDSPPFSIPITQTRNDTLNRHLWRLKKSPLLNTQREETIRLINKYLCSVPLSDDELNATILRGENNEELVTKEFFGDKNVFLHDKLGDFMIKSHNIRRDAKTRLLYHYDEMANIYRHDEDCLLGAMTRLVPSLKDFQKKETLRYIEQYLYQDRVHFNQNPYNIVFNNGLLNVETMQMVPMGPHHHETIKLNVDYNPQAFSQTVKDFFHTATQGCQDTQRLLLEAIGYSMLKTNEMEKVFILTGEGRNGKSTFLSLIKKILSLENVTNVSLKDMANNFRVSLLDNKLASLAGDISNQAILDTDLFKSITSGEDILFEKKYQQAYTGAAFATLFFACNQLPRTPDTSDGFYRRWMIIPFNANLDKVSAVEGVRFKRNLEKQESLEMIAYMAVQAIHNVLMNTNEFTEPASVKQMLEDYRTDNSSVLAWVQEKYDKQPEKLAGENSVHAFGMYKLWTEDSGYKCVRIKRFYDEIERAFKLEVQGKKFVKK